MMIIIKQFIENLPYMPYQHTLIKRSYYLYVRIVGNCKPGNEYADSMSGWKLIAKECQKENLHKVMTVLNLSGRLPVMSAYRISGFAGQLGMARQCKIAIVDINKESLQDNQFGETVAVNRGIQVKTFDNEKDAKKWLAD